MLKICDKSKKIGFFVTKILSLLLFCIKHTIIFLIKIFSVRESCFIHTFFLRSKRLIILLDKYVYIYIRTDIIQDRAVLSTLIAVGNL